MITTIEEPAPTATGTPIVFGELLKSGAVVAKNGYASGEHNSDGAGVPHLRPFNVTADGRISLEQVKSVIAPDAASPYWLRPGDVIFNNTNSEELVGKTAFLRQPTRAVLSNHMTYLRVSDRRVIDAQWLAFWLQYLWQSGVSRTLCRRHVNQASIGIDRLGELPLLLPPLDEQRCTARILSTIQGDIQAETAAIAATEAVRRSLGTLFVEDWPTRRIGDLAKVGNGSTPKRDDARYWVNGDIPWLTSGKIHDGRIDHADQFVTPTALTECHLPRVPAGSVLVAITGQGKTLGNAALLNIDACVSQHLAYIRLTTEDILPEFLYQYLRTRYEDLRSNANGGGSTKGALTCSFLASYNVPVPSVTDQETVIRALAAVDAVLSSHRIYLGALNHVYMAALATVFGGAA